MPDDRDWFVLVWTHGKPYGPLTLAELREAAATGDIAPNTRVCRYGWNDWHEAHSIPALRAKLSDAPTASPTAFASETQELKHNNRLLCWIWLSLVVALWGMAVMFGANTKQFWLWWEAGALGITTAYTIVFYVLLFVRADSDGIHLYKGIEAFIGIVPFCCLLAVICLICSTVVSICEALEVVWFRPILGWFGWLPNDHALILLFLVLAASFFCLVDVIFRFKHKNHQIKMEFGRALLFNGVPVLAAFALLLIFVLGFDRNWTDVLRSFIGGAVAFETIVSNTMFAILFYDPKV